jgi:hypothetical protein
VGDVIALVKKRFWLPGIRDTDVQACQRFANCLDNRSRSATCLACLASSCLRNIFAAHVVTGTFCDRTEVGRAPRELLPKGSSDAIGDRIYPTRALSSAVEHTLYMGEVARSIRAAPTITFSKKFEDAASTIAGQAAAAV